ncbi:MAG TPA: PhoU domain-containing protein [Ktedonobacterales bacterium]|nr:PhoU domain-containing protein [Ktedonobacterales bacterium]
MSNRGAGFGWDDDGIHKLVEMVTELGIEVEDILFNAVTALLGEGTHGAQKASEAGEECEMRYQMAHQLGLELIMAGRATADEARWIMELQEIGQSFRHISQEAVRIAMQSLAMRQPVEDVLVLAGASMNLLEYLVELTRIQVRNAIIFSTSRDRKYARSIIEDSTDLERAYNVLESHVHAAIRERPHHSFPMQQLLSIATRLEHIGRTCHRIAAAVLYDPPSKH